MPQISVKIDLGHILTILTMVAALLIGLGEYRRDSTYIKEFMAESRADRTAITLKMRELDSRVVKVETQVDEHLHGNAK